MGVRFHKPGDKDHGLIEGLGYALLHTKTGRATGMMRITKVTANSFVFDPGPPRQKPKRKRMSLLAIFGLLLLVGLVVAPVIREVLLAAGEFLG